VRGADRLARQAEPRRREPLLELRFFRSVPFSGTTLIAIAAFAALSGYLFLNALYLQQARGLTPLAAGLLSLPSAAITADLLCSWRTTSSAFPAVAVMRTYARTISVPLPTRLPAAERSMR